MTDGTFRTWEMVTLGIGVTMMLIELFITDLGGAEPNHRWFLISAIICTAAFFAKPVWLLGNWKEIRKWERTTAVVCKSYSTGRGRGLRYWINLEFFSKDGKIYHKTVEFFCSDI